MQYKQYLIKNNIIWIIFQERKDPKYPFNPVKFKYFLNILDKLLTWLKKHTKNMSKKFNFTLKV